MRGLNVQVLIVWVPNVRVLSVWWPNFLFTQQPPPFLSTLFHKVPSFQPNLPSTTPPQSEIPYLERFWQTTEVLKTLTAMATKKELGSSQRRGFAVLSGWSGVALLVLQMGCLPAAWED